MSKIFRITKKLSYGGILFLIFFISFNFARGKRWKVYERFSRTISLEEKKIAKIPAKILSDISPKKNFPLASFKKFVIVIPSYNNEKWVHKNLLSVINQNYDNYRVIYIDDNSSDKTYCKAQKIITHSILSNRTIVQKNRQRFLAMHNLYHAIHSCEDDEIIVSLDGDDWFAHENVLRRLNEVYQNPDVWLTYAHNIVYPKYNEIQSAPLDENLVKQEGFRGHKWVTAQLRTFYAGLFKKIKKEDLLLQGKFLEAGCDLGYMFPLLEMAAGRYRFIPEVLYIYNQDHPFNDHKVHQEKLQATWRYVLSKDPYAPLESISL